MSVTGRPFADVAVFFRDTCEYKVFRVERDPEDVAAVDQAVDTFWHDYVEADVMPAITGTEGEMKSLTGWHGLPDGEVRFTLDPEANQAISDYQDAAAREKQAKADKTEAATKLAAQIGKGKGLETDVARVTWVRSEVTKLDAKRLQAEHPEIWQAYSYRQVRNGGLRIKEL